MGMRKQADKGFAMDKYTPGAIRRDCSAYCLYYGSLIMGKRHGISYVDNMTEDK